jgi:Organic Anion Transporter Polypeptide (OATP) family
VSLETSSTGEYRHRSWPFSTVPFLSSLLSCSFLCIVPPKIDDDAPPTKRGLWLAFFFTAIPAGTALGYGELLGSALPFSIAIATYASFTCFSLFVSFRAAFGGQVSAHMGWRWMFFLEAMPMIPLFITAWFMPYSSKRVKVIKEVEQALSAENSSTSLTLTNGGAGDASSSTALVPASTVGAGRHMSSETTPILSASNKTRSMSNSSAGATHSGNASAPGSTKKAGAKSRLNNKKKTKSDAEEELLAGLRGAEDGDDDADGSAPGTPPAGSSRGGSMSEGAKHHAHTGSSGSVGSGSGVTGATHGTHLSVHSTVHYPHHNPPTAEEVMREAKDELAVVAIATGDASAAQDVVPSTPATSSFWIELKSLFCNPIYQAVVLGYAGFTAVVAGVGTFAPTFIVGLRLIDDKATASTVAGGVVAISGIIGTTMGGKLLDWGQLKAKRTLDAAKAKAAAVAVVASSSAGSTDGTVVTGGFYSPTGTNKKVPIPPAIHRSVSKLLGLSGNSSRNSSASSGLVLPPGIISGEPAPAHGSINAAAASGYQPPVAAVGAAADNAPLLPGLVPTAPAVTNGSTFQNPLPAASSGEAVGVAAGVAEDDDEDITELPRAEGEGADDDEDATSPEILDLKLHVTLSQATLLSAAGSLIMVAAVFATLWGMVAFMGILTVGTILLMGTTSGVNLAMMASVEPEARSFAVGLGTLMLHALGDVPAQPLIGDLAATLAPCIDGNCDNRDAAGLRDTLLATTAWLAWPCALWAAAWVMVSRRSAQRRLTGFYDRWNDANARKKEEQAAARSRAASEALKKLMIETQQAAGSGAADVTLQVNTTGHKADGESFPLNASPVPASAAVTSSPVMGPVSSSRTMSIGGGGSSHKVTKSEPGLELQTK